MEKKVNDQSKYVITKRIVILLLTEIYIFETKYRGRRLITTYGKIEHQLKFVPADHRITQRYLDQPRLTLNFLSTCLALEFSTRSNIFNLSRSRWHVLQFPLNLQAQSKYYLHFFRYLHSTSYHLNFAIANILPYL